MADKSNLIVDCDDPRTRQKLLASGLPENGVVWDFLGYKIRAALQTEATLTVVNTGAATDTQLIVKSDSMFSFARNTLFSSTLQNENKDKQAIIGLMFSVDHTVTSPDTDAGLVNIDLLLSHKSGATRTYSAKETTWCRYSLYSAPIVESAGIETLPYFGPLIYDLHKPIIIARNEDMVEYISGVCLLYKCTAADRMTRVAHTVVTTYTIKVNAYVIVCDVELTQMFETLDDLWARFMKEA
jgi:hypothetical protein